MPTFAPASAFPVLLCVLSKCDCGLISCHLPPLPPMRTRSYGTTMGLWLAGAHVFAGGFLSSAGDAFNATPGFIKLGTNYIDPGALWPHGELWVGQTACPSRRDAAWLAPLCGLSVWCEWGCGGRGQFG